MDRDLVVTELLRTAAEAVTALCAQSAAAVGHVPAHELPDV